MSRTLAVTLYQYDELSPDAQARARDWWRDLIEPSDFADFTIADAATIADLLGVSLNTRTVKLYGGGTRQEPVVGWSLDNGGGVGFSGTYAYRAGSVAAVREHAPQDAELHRIAAGLAALQRRHFYKLVANLDDGRDGWTLLVEDAECDHCGDNGVSRTDACALEELLRDFAAWIHSQLQAEYEYATSDEVLADNIRANEYEFTEEGKRA